MNSLVSLRRFVSRPATLLAPLPRVTFAPHVPIFAFPRPRLYSASTGLSKADIESRVLGILNGFDKVDQTKVSPAAHFTKDLGLDSLDTVEVVMAIEEEFSVEIPDKDADEIKNVEQAVDYISKREDAH